MFHKKMYKNNRVYKEFKMFKIRELFGFFFV